MNIDTNYRRLRFDGNTGRHRIARESLDFGEGHLCSHCARKNCAIRDRVGLRLDFENFRAVVYECGEFVPAFVFSLTRNLDAPSFNTFRLGKSWSERLRKGAEVAIFHGKKGEVVGYRRVVDIQKGKLEEMAARHALHNHQLLGEKVDDPTGRMLQIMRNAYGTNRATKDAQCTVIYLGK